MSKEPVDITARARALSPTESFHVESPAGAGKTSLLTARFIRLLSVVDHPHEILALTFTNKATNEMRQRISSLLRQAERGTLSNDPWVNSLLPRAQEALRKHARHIDLLKSPDGLRIMTFHGFCLLLVRQTPCDARVPLEAIVAGDEDQSDLLAEAVRNTQQALFQLPSEDPVRQALQRRLLHMNNNWPSLEAELINLLARRDLLGDLIREVRVAPSKEHLTQVLTERLETFISFKLEELRISFLNTELGRNWASLWAHLHEKREGDTGHIPTAIPGSNWNDLNAWQAIADLCLTQAGAIRQQFGVKNGFCPGFKQTEWAEYIDSMPEGVASLLQSTRELPLSNAPLIDIESFFDLILVVNKTLQVYNNLCRRRGVMDYVELELAALRALDPEDAPNDLQILLDQKIQHILVDEFQDTSRNQWQILQHLCAGWQSGDGRTIFIVGDPKQSIYGFRKAEVSIFMEARNGIPIPGQGDLKPNPVNLTTNFRSCARLINFTNEIFGQTIMTSPDGEVDEVPYQAFLPAPNQQGNGEIFLATFTKDDNPPEEPRFREASWLAQEVRRLSRNCHDKTIGILLPARTYLATYLKALAQEKLQVQVQEGILLKERPEVMDLFSLIRALARPHDDLSWASLLRSAWCWVNADILYMVSKQEAITWAEKIGKFQEDVAAPEVLKDLWRSITRHAPQVGRRPLAELVSSLWEELGGPHAVCARFGPAAVENCRRFLRMLANTETGIPEETLSRLELFMETAYAPPDPLATRSPVQIMTVHRAKGLEFDYVFLPYLDWNPLGGSSNAPPPYLLERLPGLRSGYMIALSPDRRQKKEDKVYNLLKRIGQRRRLGESKRLFYVATTRAKNALYLSGLITERKGEYKATKYSFLSYLLAHDGLRTQVKFLQDPVTMPPKTIAPVVPSAEELPMPISFLPERLPYTATPPSSLKGDLHLRETISEVPTRWAPNDYNLARGTVIHRLLEHLTKREALPTESAVAAALLAEGVDEHTSGGWAKGILSEVAACQKEKFCSYILRADHPFTASEWAIEDRPDGGTVRSGVLDRVVFDGQYWWLVDYKTAPLPPGVTVEEFLKEQESCYREQLIAYRDMLIHGKQIDPGNIRLILYFTAIPKAHEIEG